MLEKCEVKSLDQNVFTLIGEQWMLITAGPPCLLYTSPSPRDPERSRKPYYA